MQRVALFVDITATRIYGPRLHVVTGGPYMLAPATSELFILDADGSPCAEPDFQAWTAWYSTLANRRILYDVLGSAVIVSTMFLGRNWGTTASPIFFDTLVMGGPLHGEQALAGTISQARENHEDAMKRARRRTHPVQDYTNG